MEPLLTIAAMMIGAAISAYFANHYYKKASEELLKESTELRRLIKIMLLGMEQNGWVKLTKDKKGNILGFEQILEIDMIRSGAKVFDPTVTQTRPK